MNEPAPTFRGAAPEQFSLMEAERRRWLERLSAACEQILANADAGDRGKAYYAALLVDVEALLARINAELRTAKRAPQ
jgi:hypothetical protein